ncbi:hypothetical protein PBT90_00080 [Algoriphagus halophytocola]|uniref:hypothetical protein n=1 Tax=Algoriphagus halophytocola TaxID=2991499 RepID=UPI0022DD544D|nr:hypothetical protein [Algoriphagus sp. TR-M9]WBL42358.1 hypothetical protein PBT90_16605 [Algoriphagus sp. TR-M9]WBL43105.1 hypothetical protein PBT90_00080 [Algoriphagus sp. TR-M9]
MTAPFSTESPVTTGACLPASSTEQITSATAGLFGKPKYNKRKIQRKNTVRKRNRRTKRMNRKFGVGFLPIRWEVNHA